MYVDKNLQKYFSASYEELLYCIHEYLRSRWKQNVTEWELLTFLREQYPEVFSFEPGAGDLLLFRTHFFLYHLLYMLRIKLLEESEGVLSMFSIHISLEEYSNEAGSTPVAYDLLQEYYLNLDHLKNATATEVEMLLHGFFQKFAAYRSRKQACKVLGVSENASIHSVRKQYYTLVKLHHPDLGGDPEKFKTIQEAMENLLLWKQG